MNHFLLTFLTRKINRLYKVFFRSYRKNSLNRLYISYVTNNVQEYILRYHIWNPVLDFLCFAVIHQSFIKQSFNCSEIRFFDEFWCLNCCNYSKEQKQNQNGLTLHITMIDDFLRIICSFFSKLLPLYLCWTWKCIEENGTVENIYKKIDPNKIYGICIWYLIIFWFVMTPYQSMIIQKIDFFWIFILYKYNAVSKMPSLHWKTQ